jgi:tetratricopeptide (TPR) repeat protein
MGGSMGKRKKRKAAAKRRGLTEEQRLRRRSKARAELLYEPGTDPALAAEILRELFGEGPVDLAVAAGMQSEIGIDRLRAVAEVALARAQDPVALSLTADVATMSGRPEEAEKHLARALQLVDDPDLHVRVALARGSQGRVADAIDALDAPLRANPGLERLQFARGRLLEQAEPAEVERFLDRTALAEMMAAVRGAAGSDDGLHEWLEAGAITEDELAALAAADPTSAEGRRLRMIAEWAWITPGPDDEPAPLEAFAADEGQPAELRRRADDWLSWAMWGLWEVDRPEGTPGVSLTDLVTGVRLYAAVPPALLAGVPRWSALFGYLVPVDGVWQSGSGFEVLSPVEARVVVHELLDEIMSSAGGFGKEGRPMVAWARGVHDDLDELWEPDAAEPPSQEAMAGLQVAVRMFAPGIVAGLRQMRRELAVEPEEDVFALTLDDPDAAWEVLAGQPGFEVEEEGLAWLGAGDDAPERAFLGREEDGEIVVETEEDDLDGLLELLRGLGHPATAAAKTFVDEPPEPPVALPDLPEADLPGWLRAWPDEPLDMFDGASPREAIERYEAGRAVEMLVRYLEHDADRRGVELDTQPLRTELELAPALALEKQ